MHQPHLQLMTRGVVGKAIKMDENLDKNFQVRRVISADELSRINDLDVREGRVDDVKCFYSADPTGFFVGELNGKKISTVSVVKYENKTAFVGLYGVDKPYRGKKYGIKTFTAGLASVDTSYNLGLNAEVQYSHLYERHGFRKTWTNMRFKIDPEVVLAAGADQAHSELTVKSTAEVDFDHLVEYDATIFGAPRHAFLKCWINAPNSKGFAAVSSSGELLGYTVIRKMILDGEGYRIGPLFANQLTTARTLLTAAAKIASIRPENRYMKIDVPGDINPQARELSEEMGGVSVLTAYRMYTKGMPEMLIANVYGVTTLELG